MIPCWRAAIAIVAAACVVLYGTLVGVGVAALLAAFNVFRRAANPHIAELGRLSDGDFGDLERLGQRLEDHLFRLQVGRRDEVGRRRSG